MSRTPLAAMAALLLAVLLAPAVLAADPGGAGPTACDPVPTPSPVATAAVPEPTPTPWDGNGEIVIDPTFVTPSATPAGQVRGSTGRPQATPPATDAKGVPGAQGGGLTPLLWLLAGGSCLALAGARVPASRRR